ncbi:tetratricopeptide repeat protein [Brucepastera parasyntrophica]|uniref:tetratricopeptide repeat protein n=1 Tax=Brucepastera parasyntrophica TaxID=2880008 RepID=UPI00210BDFCD|nr:tetratricopeptide repeat protein [Brucepastera parasyntrophica]ULQ60700.1 tetratricopeptide repeat protein [Brucepastera parasyntrophica]
MEKKIGCLLVFLFLVFMSGCTPAKPALKILSGALASNRQDFDMAVMKFLTAEHEALIGDNPSVWEYAEYGLVSVYLIQNEYEAAQNRLEGILDASSPDIRSGAWYHFGIIAYRRGEYQEAASYFRKALENKPDSIDAKINLELSLQNTKDETVESTGQTRVFHGSTDEEHKNRTIFDLIRKKEQDRWKNQKDTADNSSIADY